MTAEKKPEITLLLKAEFDESWNDYKDTNAYILIEDSGMLGDLKPGVKIKVVEPVTQEKAPTWEECKNQIAVKYGLGTTLVMGHKETYYREAAELYARSREEAAWKRACEAMRIECFEAVAFGRSILLAPAPEFNT